MLSAKPKARATIPVAIYQPGPAEPHRRLPAPQLQLPDHSTLLRRNPRPHGRTPAGQAQAPLQRITMPTPPGTGPAAIPDIIALTGIRGRQLPEQLCHICEIANASTNAPAQTM